MAQRTQFKLVLRVLAISLLAACNSGSNSERSEFADPIDGSILYADVVRYVDFWIHRTAYPGDLHTAEWVRDELALAGLDAELLAWEVNQFFLEEVHLEVGGKSYDAFPAWYPKMTGPSVTFPATSLS